MAKIVLILGGARSGKSRFAQQLAQSLGTSDVLFFATAQAGDDEMRGRIALHKRQRPAGWATCEIASQIAPKLLQKNPAVAIIDCLTLLVSNTMLANEDSPQEEVEKEIDELLRACQQMDGAIIIVSGEVGCGIVPPTPLGRQFRDLLGRANQAIAAQADAVYFLIAGLPIEVKSLSLSVAEAARALLSKAESES